MIISDYLKSTRAVILTCLAGGFFFSVLLLLYGITPQEMLLLWICFLLIVAASLCCGYVRLYKRLRYLLSVTDSLEKKYLAAEIADKPVSAAEKVYFQIMKEALKSMTDEVAQNRRANTEYRDFIEQWVHEIKVPMTGIQLLCENNRSDVIRKIMSQTEQIEREVERVLFFARLGSVEKDYFIREISLKDCVFEALAANRQFLIQSGACIYTDGIGDTVYSDSKWIVFIISQVIINSVKYRSEASPVITVESEKRGDSVVLSVTDNGVGIPLSGVGRVNEEGWVGRKGMAVKGGKDIVRPLC